MIADVRSRMFATVDLFLWEARWYHDGQQVFWLDEEGLGFPGQVDVK